MCIKDKGRLWPGEMGSMCQGPQTEVAQNQKARHFFWNYADEHCLNNDMHIIKKKQLNGQKHIQTVHLVHFTGAHSVFLNRLELSSYLNYGLIQDMAPIRGSSKNMRSWGRGFRVSSSGTIC